MESRLKELERKLQNKCLECGSRVAALQSFVYSFGESHDRVGIAFREPHVAGCWRALLASAMRRWCRMKDELPRDDGRPIDPLKTAAVRRHWTGGARTA